MIMYKLLTNDLVTNKPSQFIKRTNDGAFIPMNEENTDYQEYLKWLAKGNEPSPAEEV